MRFFVTMICFCYTESMIHKKHMKKKLVVANWKMNPTNGKTAQSWFKKIQAVAHKYGKTVETVVCPPAVYLESLQQVVTDRSCVLGAQDCFWEASGSYTGEISPEMIFNAKARYVIVGHSERRALGETNQTVNKKITMLLQFPLSVIVCVGEHHRTANGNHFKEITKQLSECLQHVPVKFYDRLVVAYEPVWAIGSKATRSATAQECFEMVVVIKRTIADLINNANIAHHVPVLYGGSTDTENALSFVTDGGADGLLVGRSSLDPSVFGKMIAIVGKNTG